MPFGSEGVSDEIGIALSGGGFRATLFHVGTFRRLTELRILTRLGRISSISGGSITAGRIADVWDDLKATPTVDNYEALVGQPLRDFCRRSIDARAGIEGLLSPWTSAGAEIEKEYIAHVVRKRLDELPDSPVFVFGATNLQTGRNFRFSKKYMGDHRIGLIDKPTLPVARAVAASSAFPPFLSPVVIKNPGTFQAVKGADLAGNRAYTRTLYLTDGGVYDNLGLESVWKRCATVLASDAGAPFALNETANTDMLRQTMRALDVATDQSRGLRQRVLVDEFQRGLRKGAYWGIDTAIDSYGAPGSLKCNLARVQALAAIRTRLNPFTDQEQGELINWGYALTDAAIRKYAPQLVPGDAPPPAWPQPRWRLDR
jgi:NTE family protein